MADALSTVDLQVVCSEIHNWLKRHGEAVDEQGLPKFSDVPAVLAHVFQAGNGDLLTKQLAADLKELEQQCLKAVKAKDNVKKAAYLTTVPPGPPTEVDADGEAALIKHPLRVWQLGFLEAYSFKGSSSLFAILEVVKTNILSEVGNQTQKFPLEVLFDCGQALPGAGSPIREFSIGTANGFAVVLGSLLCCIVSAQKGWMKPDSSLTVGVRSELGKRLLKCIRLHATYSPKADLRSQAQLTLSTKIQASNRSRPTTLQMLFVFQRVVDSEVQSGTRKSKPVILQDALSSYNQREAVRSQRINADEISAIKFLNDRSPAFRSLLKVVWGVERPPNTAVPMNLLSADWLQEAASLPVPQS